MFAFVGLWPPTLRRVPCIRNISGAFSSPPGSECSLVATPRTSGPSPGPPFKSVSEPHARIVSVVELSASEADGTHM